jgi:hypothetical protein
MIYMVEMALIDAPGLACGLACIKVVGTFRLDCRRRVQP